jgi:Crp-like helix-turn-helix domain
MDVTMKVAFEKGEFSHAHGVGTATVGRNSVIVGQFADRAHFVASLEVFAFQHANRVFDGAERAPRDPARSRSGGEVADVRKKHLLLTELSGGRVEGRLARFFLKLAHDMGQRRDGGTFIPLVLSRQELADMIGTTIETSIRIMSRWSKDGVVRTEKDGFVVEDHAALEAASLT